MKSYKLIYLITILSGAAGLIYEIAWTRMLVVNFGNSTHSIVAVVSAFLGGLAIGSVLIGTWVDKKTSNQLLKTYCSLELAIGVLAISTLLFLPITSDVYALFSDGSTLTPFLLTVKFLLTTAVLLLPTTLMGGTVPVLACLLQFNSPKIDKNISLLYSLNTFGAICGVIFAAFFTIELLGLTGTVLIGVILNFLAGLLILVIPKKSLLKETEVSTINLSKSSLSIKEKIVLICFFVSGLISIAYELLWTRLLTPTTGTYTYAFAFILVIYLLGITIGSIGYNKYAQLFKNNKNFIFAISQLGIGIFALSSVLIISNYIEGKLLLTLAVILPASIFMGISFPAAIGLLRDSHNHGKQIGISYFSNTSGSIVGAIVTSLILIPLVGSLQSIILLTLGNFLLALILISLELKLLSTTQRPIFLSTLVLLILAIMGLLVYQGDKLFDGTTKKWLSFANAQNARVIFKEDNIASVIGIQGQEGYKNVLLVDGVAMTVKVIETRLMAHLPIAFHKSPKSMLVICFGMGSTYRSALLHQLNTDVVELSSAVANMSSLFYSDISNLAANGKGKVIINDGRNYVKLTKKKYDLVTIDPPPPFNAAGTTVLYSEDFYKNMLHALNSDSVVMQWVPAPPRPDDTQMVTKSFLNVFPFVIALKSPGLEKGVFLIGSLSPIRFDQKRINDVFHSKIVTNDLAEFSQKVDAGTIFPLITNRDELIKRTQHVDPVTDDHPRTEYFGLRHIFTPIE